MHFTIVIDLKRSIKHKIENLTLEKENGYTNETLVLDTLAEESVDKVDDIKKLEDKKYVPPKSKKHLSPSVRKIVKEGNIDISTIEGTGKAGRISKKKAGIIT